MLDICLPPREQDGEGVSEAETNTLTGVDGVTETPSHLLAGYLRYINHQVGKHHSITKSLSDQTCAAKEVGNTCRHQDLKKRDTRGASTRLVRAVLSCMARLRRMVGRLLASPSRTRPMRKGRVASSRTVLRPARSDRNPPARLPPIPDNAQLDAG